MMEEITQYAVATALYGDESEDGLAFICTKSGVARKFLSASAAQQYIDKHELNFTNTVPKKPIPLWFPCLIVEIKIS